MKKFITQKLNKFFGSFVMTTKKLILSCAVLSVLAVVCVGFSSWIIVNPSIQATVNAAPFEVYTVTDSQNYLTLRDPKGFDYYDTGFTDGNGNLTATGDVSFEVKLNAKTASDFLEATQGMLLQFSIYFTGVMKGDEASATIPPANCVITQSNTEIATVRCKKGTAGGDYCLKAVFDTNNLTALTGDSAEEITFTVTFRLENKADSSDETDEYAYSNLFRYLKDGKSFMVEARVSRK